MGVQSVRRARRSFAEAHGPRDVVDEPARVGGQERREVVHEGVGREPQQGRPPQRRRVAASAAARAAAGRTGAQPVQRTVSAATGSRPAIAAVTRCSPRRACRRR